MIKWLLSLSVVQKMLEIVVKQGFSVLLLICAVGWFGYQNYILRTYFDAKVLRLEDKVDQCNNNLIQYYRDDHMKSEKIIERNTDLLQKLEKKL